MIYRWGGSGNWGRGVEEISDRRKVREVRTLSLLDRSFSCCSGIWFSLSPKRIGVQTFLLFVNEMVDRAALHVVSTWCLFFWSIFLLCFCFVFSSVNPVWFLRCSSEYLKNFNRGNSCSNEDTVVESDLSQILKRSDQRTGGRFFERRVKLPRSVQ